MFLKQGLGFFGEQFNEVSGKDAVGDEKFCKY